jgi:hypothetical protein
VTAPAAIDEGRWYYRGAYLPWARALARYHRARLEGGPPPDGPCIYVALHGAGYLVLDLMIAGYLLAWRTWHEGRGPRTPLRIVAAESRIEKVLPGLPTAKRHLGLVDPSEESCRAVLARGEQLLVTPGGLREARPSRDFYRLRWAGRYGFVRLALATGARRRIPGSGWAGSRSGRRSRSPPASRWSSASRSPWRPRPRATGPR